MIFRINELNKGEAMKRAKTGKTRKAKKKIARKTKASKKAKPKKQAKIAKPSQQITGSMIFSAVLEKYPDTAFVMLKYGLHCVGCRIASYETVEEGARAHGLDEKTIKKMIDDMNKVASSKKK